MRGKSRSRYSSRASKRKTEASSSTSEPKPKRLAQKNDVAKVDNYCWLCHEEGGEKICNPCHRAYHIVCLDKASASFSETQACPECITTTVDGTELNSNKFFSLDKLKKMLDILTRRSFDKKREKNRIFFKWPEGDRDKLFKIVDFEIMLDNIHRLITYTKPAELYSDVKYIYHNSCIAYGADSVQAKAAENLRKDFKAELLVLEACPECYFYFYCDKNDSFVRLCDSPHDIVWAQLTKHPHWPAKCLKVVKGIAHVRFFGKHEQSNISISKCFCISKSHPKYKNSSIYNPFNNGPKLKSYEPARTELLEYITLYTQKYGKFPYSLHKTPYEPQVNQNEVVIVSTEGSCIRNSIQMKMESLLNEDTEDDVANEDDIADTENSSVQNCVTSGLQNGSMTEGQFPTLAQLNPSIDVSSSPVQDQLGKNLNGAPSVGMSFVADEPNFNIENVNPVVSSIVSKATSTILSSATENLLKNLPPVGQNREGFSLPSVRNETVDTANLLTRVVANTISNESFVQPDVMHNFVNNFTESHSEMDNEVQCIGQKRVIQVDMPINPQVILPVLMNQNPDLKEAIKKVYYVLDGLMVSLWCSLGPRSAGYEGKVSKLSLELRKAKSEINKIVEENDKLKREIESYKISITNFVETIAKLEVDNKDLREKDEANKERHIEASNNAKIVITGLKEKCHAMMMKTKEEFMASIRNKDACILQKDQQLRDAEEKIKNLEKRANNSEERSKSLEEENGYLKEELEEAKVEIQSKESKLKAKRFQISPDEISVYKTNHFCRVCEKTAGTVCCINTSYCGPECQMEHAEEHKKECRREITSQSFMQHTYRQQTETYVHKTHGAVPVEDSTLDYSSNSGTNFCLQKTQIQRVSALALRAIPQDQNTSSPSCSYTPKNKRRFNK